MTSSLMDEYCDAWPAHPKIELIGGQLIVGDNLAHSRLLLSHLLRGWGIDAFVALAPEQLWWQALRQTFAAPAIDTLATLNGEALLQWATQLDYQPETPHHQSEWRWAYSEWRQTLRLAMFGLTRRDEEQLGQSLGGGFVNRLGDEAVMPDILFIRGQPRNRLYEYYLDGPTEVVVEFLRPGEEVYVRNTKRDLYQAARVPEFWIVDPARQQIELLRWIEGHYCQQTPDEAGRYRVSSLPGLSFFPDRLWQPEDTSSDFLPESLFQVAPDVARVASIPYVGVGVDWGRGRLPLPVALAPVAIAFDDYIYWCPEAKFEFIEGRPYIGGREGIQGLIGMLAMTFGLAEVVKLAHPSDWVRALLELRLLASDSTQQANWWNLARQMASVLCDRHDITRIAIAGDLATGAPLNYWSELVLVVWGLPKDGLYFMLDTIVRPLSEQPQIRFIDANRHLTPIEERLLQEELVELSP
jgi:Uma2 family endonuclease